MFSPKEIAASACQLVEHEEDYGRCHDAVFSALTALQTSPLPGKPFSMCVQSNLPCVVTVVGGGLNATLKSGKATLNTQCTQPGLQFTGSNGVTVSVSVNKGGNQINFPDVKWYFTAENNSTTYSGNVMFTLINCPPSTSGPVKLGIIVASATDPLPIGTCPF
jgi:hypothetical protein